MRESRTDYYNYLIRGLIQSLAAAKTLHKTEILCTFSMGYRERGYHARGVYPTQDTSHTGTARMKLEKEADIRIIVKDFYEIWNVETWAL